MKENDIPLLATSVITTLMIGFNVLSVWSLLEYFDWLQIPSNKYFVLIPLGTILIVVYFFFVKPLKFLTYGFKKDTTGGIYIVLYLIFTVILSVFVANINRAKLEEQKNSNSIDVNNMHKRQSLEGNIKKWFKG